MSTQSSEQFIYITTTGRKTGLPREIEIWFVEHEGCVFILAEHGTRAQWVKNILINPNVRVRLGDHVWSAIARVLDPEQDAERYLKVRSLAGEKYGWGDGLPVEIRRVSE